MFFSDFPLSWSEAVIACLITITGSTIQGAVGIGLGFIAVPLLVLIRPEFVPGPLLLAALPLTLLISYREQQSIDFSGIKWAISGRIAGTVVGAVLLVIIAPDKLTILFGIMVLLAVLLSISGLRLQVTPGTLVGSGTLSGLMGTTSAIGGVPLALLYQHYQGARLRGTLSGIFVLGTGISIGSLVYIGKFHILEMKLALVLLPGIILGFYLSKKLAKIMDTGLIRPAVLIISSLSGIFIIIRSIIRFG
jgi:uncharacterized membrane protein YfcA